ncbi:MAG: transglycosylase SLT domain-containing protein [Pseudomonadota bacterium]|jgi:membrane-bound lytic murein transglycosylase D|uniref:transglycosylase SLT domain-containing protein n=1 Tax=Curvibacter delicatus TaxID=80879 RepID=UPI0008362E47|nr:transglycosylase SLT domain-containing protein [Curvibacter delicatus]MEA3393165.1 transglycosylase SLT domain-containing protein [Pseudomonadota bacterium]
MKFLISAALAGLLLLSGCANMAPANPTASADAGTPRSSSRAPTLPAGNLSPIQARNTAARGGVAPLTAPADLWERIRLGFAMPELDSDLVRDREQWYASRPDYIFRMTERSRKYLFHIVEELERRNMPTELALLPFIESAFNPQAVSSAKAAGMWQFMPATGKYFELKQNVFRDDRRDVLASTRAALDYLQKLYGMFGDWHLALAAYNWGEGSVGRAIAKNQRAGVGTTYLDLNMPMETRFYVPKLQAVKNIVARPQDFNAQLPLIENHPYFDSVTITRDIDVALAAKLAEVPLEDFKALNPSLNKPVILAAGTPQILLPWDNATRFQRNLEAYSSRLASWTVWVAPSTMKVADAAKRAGMSEAELRNVNNIPPRMLIRAGSTLLVPRYAHHENDVTERIADNGQVAFAPEVVLRRTVVKAGKHESVASIAKRYRQTPASVAEWNKVSASAAFKAGQQVVLFLPVQPRAMAKAKTATRVVAKATPRARPAKAPATKVARR